MPSFCLCLRESRLEHPVTLLSTIAEFIFSAVLSIMGVLINWKLWKQLQLERKHKPIGRKGNVIEPIMRWFCIHQMFYSPIYFIFYWMRANGVLPLDIPSWLCMAMSDTVHLGRIVTSFNSLFVVIVRYIYIVHDGKVNQWHFERVGRRFQIASMVIPLFITAIMLWSVDPFLFMKRYEIISNCPNVYNDSLKQNEEIISVRVQSSNIYLPEAIVSSIGIFCSLILTLVSLNVVDAFLYFKIFRKIKR